MCVIQLINYMQSRMSLFVIFSCGNYACNKANSLVYVQSSFHITKFSVNLSWEILYTRFQNDIPPSDFIPLIIYHHSSVSHIQPIFSYRLFTQCTAQDGAAAVHFAAGDGSISRLSLLIDAGANIEAVSQSGTALHWAAGGYMNSRLLSFFIFY